MNLSHIVLLASKAENSMGERISTALLNTAMGITIVFLVLILISFIISCFRFIHKLEMKLQGKKEAKNSSVQVDAVIQQIARQEEALMDDLELVAVITAAIHSYEEASGNPIPANGLYVRSIKKVNRTKWRNA